MTSVISRADHIFALTQSLCSSFAAKKPFTAILSHFTETQEPVIIEHCSIKIPQLPFLSTFRGPQIAEYFELLAELFEFEDMKFYDWTLDVESERVCVKATAKFTWKKTQQSWNETFTYSFTEFDEDGKIGKYEVWGDPLTAYLASKGELKGQIAP
ncbi:hypothetical protein NEOLI_000256 [Neolecta irregularis DAH-3]|uniref:SnoaL-like domain-containing protein n=1 Tax=Neolecta irregularis (strain DAH-3) TaxID=1198029 RepID=A0A1U7LIZ7_NEOID|nr:hypothetical protein NEOLI_000256 [Neolecta irregularis DAH-3]|eukprot:OLL22630.1 hypothetical protein NEOLI_000256 [Neolecta irregularis DAH-3]